MAPNIVRAVIVSAVFMLAYMILAPFGLGWVVIMAFITYLAFSLYWASRQVSVKDEDDGERHAGRVGGDTLRRLRERGARLSKDDPAERTRQERERARQEADCGLTHEERVKFHDIIQNLNDDRA